MADEKERVLYEFQGDVSSLKKATNDALGMLDKFQDQMNKLNSNGIVKASQRAQSGFQNSVNKMTKSIDTVQKKLKAIGDVRMPRSSEAFKATKQAADSLTSVLNELNSSNTITSKSLNEMKAKLNDITSSLKNAGPSFDNLISKEEKFQNRLESIGNTANSFSTKIQGATNKVQSTFSSMGSSIGAIFNTIGNKFEPIVSKLQGFKDKAVIAGNRIFQAFSTVAAAFRRTSDGTEGASRSQNLFGKILDSIREKLNRHRKALDNTSDGYELMENASNSASSSMQSNANTLTSALSGVKNVLGGIVDSFTALAGVQLGDLLSDGAKEAINYVENLNLFKVAMGNSIDEGTAFVDKMQEVYGMDPSNIYRYTGYFYQLTDAIGMSEKASATMSLSMTKAANDIASLFNKDIKTVVDDLASGMQGMSRTVRKYGVDIRATTLQETAFRYGLTDKVETMSEANRQALRYITILEQTQNALKQTTKDVEGASTELGDFARNIETPANQLRIFKEQMSQLGRAIGTFIIAPLQKALPYINGFIMALRIVVNALAAIAGVSVDAGSSLDSVGEAAEDVSEDVGDIGEEAAKATKELKQLLAPFDELNVLQESSSGTDKDLNFDGELDPSLAKALEDMQLNLEDITMKANQVRDAILEFLGLEITTDPITQEQIIQWDKEAFMSNVMDSLYKFKEWFLNLTPLQQGIIIAAGVAAGLLALGGFVSSIISALPFLISAFQGVIDVLGFLTGPVGITIAALATLLVFSEDFRTAFIELFSQVGDSIFEWGNILAGVFTTVGTDIVNMWDTHILPTIEAIGTMCVPVLETLGSLWGNLSVIVAGVFSLIGNLWTEVLKPVIEGAMEIIQDLCAIIKDWWEKYFGPVIEYIGDGLETLWTEKLKPVFEKIISILGDVIELIMALWNTVLEPIIVWLGKVFGPIILEVFKAVWDGIEWAVSLVINIIDSLLDVLGGVIDFLVGVFTGDWERAWKGIVNIFVGIGNLLIDIFEGVINGVIWLINSLVELVFQGIQGLINIVLGAVEGIAELLGFELNLTLNASVPNIPSVSIPRIPEMASGGVVTGPTHLIAGEGKYSEAILPLDDSPQMQDLIDKIVEAIDKDDPDPKPVEVKVYIGDTEYDAYTYKASERGKKIVGKQPIKMGG